MDILKLRKQINALTNDSIHYVLIPITKKTSQESLDELIPKLCKEYCDDELLEYHIIYEGDLTKYHYYKELVTKFKKRHHGNVPIYRNYCVSEEKQKQTSMFCNVAEDSTTSWNTAISAIGSKFGIILKLKYGSRDSKIIQEREELDLRVGDQSRKY